MRRQRGRATLQPYKIDLKDRRILHELDRDARQHFSDIGRKVGLSESVVRYRVQRLQQAGVLKGCFTFIDTQKLGYQFHNIYVRFKVIFADEEARIIEALKKLPNVCWLVSTSGAYNLVISILARDIQHFRQVQNEVVRILEGCIIEDSVFIVTDACQLAYPLLSGQPHDFTQEPHKIGGHKIELQPLDKAILHELASNARMTTLELARKLRLNQSTIAEHLSRLLKSDMIQGFKPLIDMTLIGKEWYLVLFKLKYIDHETQKTFMAQLKAIPQTFFIVNGVGNWGIQCEFYVDNDQELRDVMKKIFPTHNNDIIKEHSELRITKEHKCVFYPVEEGATQKSLEIWLPKKQKQRPSQMPIAEEPEIIIQRNR